MDHLMTMKNPDSSDTQLTGSQERLHKSELNVVLMPKAMPLIGFDKYKNIQRYYTNYKTKKLLKVAFQKFGKPHFQKSGQHVGFATKFVRNPTIFY